jgi:hypothetical protein
VENETGYKIMASKLLGRKSLGGLVSDGRLLLLSSSFLM